MNTPWIRLFWNKTVLSKFVILLMKDMKDTLVSHWVRKQLATRQSDRRRDEWKRRWQVCLSDTGERQKTRDSSDFPTCFTGCQRIGDRDAGQNSTMPYDQSWWFISALSLVDLWTTLNYLCMMIYQALLNQVLGARGLNCCQMRGQVVRLPAKLPAPLSWPACWRAGPLESGEPPTLPDEMSSSKQAVAH